jgi:hypothetical protein
MPEQHLHKQQSREQQRHPSSAFHAARRLPLIRKRKE